MLHIYGAYWLRELILQIDRARCKPHGCHLPDVCALIFWLPISMYQITSKLSGVQHPVTLTDSVGQEFGQGIMGAICFCSTMSGASAGRLGR